LWTICPSWPQILILRISASYVAGIIDMSHQHLASGSLVPIQIRLILTLSFSSCWIHSSDQP
jgi:hypothetical protein